MFIILIETNCGYCYLNSNSELVKQYTDPMVFETETEAHKFMHNTVEQAYNYAECVERATKINARVLYGFIRDHHKRDLLIKLIDTIMDEEHRCITHRYSYPNYYCERI